MPKLTKRLPKLCRDRDQAVVYIDGEKIPLGRYGSRVAQREYDRVVGEWLQRGRTTATGDATSLAQILVAYLKYAKKTYRKNGKETEEVGKVKALFKVVRSLFTNCLAEDFGPLALKTCMTKMVELDWGRTYINDQRRRMVQVMKWAAAHEMVSGQCVVDLQQVSGLRKGEAPEGEPVKPVDDAAVYATAQLLNPILKAMVKLQRATGCRPGEVCIVRPCDIDKGSEVWVYRPHTHKTEHVGKERSIPVGPKAQAILKPFLNRDDEIYCFSPREAEEHRLRELHVKRTTPISCGNRPGKRSGRRGPSRLRDHYDSRSYARAIKRACEAAEIETWTPNQLRHTRATEVRAAHGLEAAQMVLGHSNAKVTEIYAERNLAAAIAVALASG